MAYRVHRQRCHCHQLSGPPDSSGRSEGDIATDSAKQRTVFDPAVGVPFACALMYAGGGKLVDVLGTRRGSLVIMLFWLAACASHAFAIGFLSLAAARFLLNERIYRKCRREARLQLLDRRSYLRHVSRRARNTVCCPVQPC